MGSWFRVLLVAVVAAGLACKGDPGAAGARGEQGPPGDPGVAFATPPLALSGASNATISLTRPMRSNGGGNLLDWRSELPLWANKCGVAPAVSIATADAQEGDTSFEFNVSTPNTAGSCEEYGDLIEIDPTSSYSGQVWAKLVGGAGNFSAGFATYDATKTFIDNRYFIANNVTLTSSTWLQFAGAIGGVGTVNNTFPANARFARSIVNPNINNIGITRVDGFKIFDSARRLPTLYRQGLSVGSQTLPNTDNSCGVAPGSPWTVLTGMSVSFSLSAPTEIELDLAGGMGDRGTRTEGLHCGVRYLIDGVVLGGASADWGHFGWSTNLWQWHGISARRRAMVGAGNHTVTVQARSGLCSTPAGSDTGYCEASSDLALGLFLEVLVP